MLLSCTCLDTAAWSHSSSAHRCVQDVYEARGLRHTTPIRHTCSQSASQHASPVQQFSCRGPFNRAPQIPAYMHLPAMQAACPGTTCPTHTRFWRRMPLHLRTQQQQNLWLRHRPWVCTCHCSPYLHLPCHLLAAPRLRVAHRTAALSHQWAAVHPLEAPLFTPGQVGQGPSRHRWVAVHRSRRTTPTEVQLQHPCRCHPLLGPVRLAWPGSAAAAASPEDCLAANRAGQAAGRCATPCDRCTRWCPSGFRGCIYAGMRVCV